VAAYGAEGSDWAVYAAYQDFFAAAEEFSGFGARFRGHSGNLAHYRWETKF
jgi:hypothetical protein